MAVHNPLAGLSLKAARWSATHPWRAILAWVGFVAVSVGLAMAVPTVNADGEDYYMGEWGRATQMIEDAGLDNPDSEVVLITADGDLDQAKAEAAAAELTERMRATDGVDAVAEPQWSEDRSALLVSVQLARDQEDVTDLQAVTEDVAADHTDLQIGQAGDNSVDDAINDQVADDLSSAEATSVPITLILMLIAFGALIAAGIPVLLAVTSVAATMGLTAPLSHLIHAEDTVSSMIVLIGMAVGVDYSLFYLKREREERAKGRTTLDAVEIAAETSGHSILVSGFAVIASMSGLFVVGGATFNSLAAGSILVVAIAVLGSITVLPALLVKLGRWVDRPRVPLLWRMNRRIGAGGISSRVLAPVVRRPAAALVVSVLAVGALAVPALGMKLHSGSLETLPTKIEEVQTLRAVADKFPSEGPAAEVVVRGGGDDARAALDQVQEAALETGRFVSAGADPIRTSKDGETSVLTLAMPYDEADDRVDRALETLRDDVLPPVLDDTGATYAVGGGAASSYDMVDHLNSYLPLVIGFILLLTMVMMGFAFRSVPIALVSTGLNLLSVGVAFGLITLVFQHGWGADLLDFSSPGFVIDWIPMFVLVVLVGLSMDYHVFVLGRVREYVEAGMPTRLAVRKGVADTAGVVTSAAAVMVSVFAIFATLSMMEMKMMGVGLSAAILIDATVIRLVMLPAILVLLGDRAWPGRPKDARGEQVAENDPGYALV
ncbi:MMPL family transporter [Nocardioides sp. Soil796]|uniref:MMPL family transporter n=1 Tax=Nocardioides sp. Soil796 TaxID=1736412 RepID=UPI000708D04B|nr:MMPL family transporter [Nocardioides sp. Soil796]KRF15886.1 RND transporter [Nocardioides sp. Soil796]